MPVIEEVKSSEFEQARASILLAIAKAAKDMNVSANDLHSLSAALENLRYTIS